MKSRNNTFPVLLVEGSVKGKTGIEYYVVLGQSTIFGREITNKDVLSVSQQSGQWFVDIPSQFAMTKLKLEYVIAEREKMQKSQNEKDALKDSGAIQSGQSSERHPPQQP